MIALTLAIMLHSKMIGVLPDFERFRHGEQCQERGKELAELIKQPSGAEVEITCERVYEFSH